MTIATLTFAQPVWLLVGLGAVVCILLLGVRLDRQRRAALRKFSSRSDGLLSSVSRPRRVLKRGLVVLGVMLGFGALARPQRGFTQEQTHRRGIDLLFAIDTSKSMLAPDLKPNRLTRAKLAVHDLVDKFGGDRVGLVAFAGEAFLQCPLTLDRDIFAQTLDAVDVGLIPRGGTDVGRAIEVAQDALHNEPGNQKILVLLTDGEDLEARAVEAARAAGKAGIQIYTVGVGTAQGELIPLSDQAAGQFVKDESGAFVRSRLDESMLKELATAAGGQYRLLGSTGQGLDALYQEVLAKLPQESLGSKMREVPIERFQWPLGLSLLCLALEPLLREQRRRRPVIQPPIAMIKPTVFRRPMAAAVLLICGLCSASVAHASPQTAEKAYHEGKFPQAQSEYQRAAAAAPDNGLLQYNAGAAAYKSGDYAQATADFEHALHNGRPDLQQKAYYNRGNTLFRVGQKTVDKQPEQTIEQWKQAIVAYESALKLAPKDADATYNRDLVTRQLAELMRQQKQADQKQKDQQNQKQQDKNQNGQPDKQAQNQNGQQDKNQKGQPEQNGQPDKNQNGQPDKQAQNQNGQQDKDQNGQQDKDKAQNGQPDKHAQNQNGQPDKDKDKNQNGQPDQQAQNQTGQPDPRQQGGNDKLDPQPEKGQQPTAATGAAAGERQDERKVPGQLSRSDAKALLDALRGDDRLMPLSPAGQQQPVSADDVVRKDW